jgi:Tfp pilus assembly protein PilF
VAAWNQHRELAVLLLVIVTVPFLGCAAGARGRGADPASDRLEQRVRQLGVDPDLVGNPLRFTPEMRDAAEAAAGQGRDLERLRRLQQYLFDKSAFPFNYTSRGTYTAIEAFERREGNCVSFTSLFIALARSLDIDVRAALRMSADAEREGDLIVVNNHMVATYEHSGGATAYDFNLRREETRIGLQMIDDIWVVAIFLNNRGAEELLARRTDAAEFYVESAVRLAPEFAAAHGNLGVIRRQRGDTAGAFAAYRRALEIDPGAPTILNNLAALYLSLGQEDEARAALRAADVRGSTAYTLMVRGDFDLLDGHVKRALRYYRRASRLEPDIPEPWIAIARAEMARGDGPAARRALERALEREPDEPHARRMLEQLPPG